MKIILGILVLLLSGNVLALDTEIRVLGMYYNGIEDFSEAKTSLSRIPQAWSTTGIGGSTPTSVTLVNGGNPLPLNLLPPGTNSLSMVQALRASAELNVARSEHGADVVIVFVGPVTADGACGAAINNHWLGAGASFQGSGPNNLDTRGDFDSYIAIVATDTSFCNNHFEVSSHEFGHLLGAGHYGNDPGLYSDSRASVRLVIDPVHSWLPAIYHFTVLGNHLTCNSLWPCLIDNRYSIGSIPYGLISQNNRKALRKTGRSVANFIIGNGTGGGGGGGSATQCADGLDNDSDGFVDLMDSDCLDSMDTTESGTNGPPAPPNTGGGSGGGGCNVLPPVNVTSFISGPLCNPIPFTRYTLSWQNLNSCPPDFYEAYFSQPVGSGYQFLLSTTNQSEDVLVDGQNANVKVRACVTGVGCTSLSTSSTTVIPRC